MRKLEILHITTFPNWRSTQQFHPIASLTGHAIGVEAVAFGANMLVAKAQWRLTLALQGHLASSLKVCQISTSNQEEKASDQITWGHLSYGTVTTIEIAKKAPSNRILEKTTGSSSQVHFKNTFSSSVSLLCENRCTAGDNKYLPDVKAVVDSRSWPGSFAVLYYP